MLPPADPLRALRATGFFSTLPVEALARLAEVARAVSRKAGDYVVTEGALGDGLYVVVSGETQVTRAGADGEELVLARLGPGEVFGEQHLLEEGGRRGANVRCRSDADLLFIGTADFRALCDRHPGIGQVLQARREQYDEATHARRTELARLLRLQDPGAPGTVRYSAGTVLFREGDAADAFYLIVAGTAAVYSEASPDRPIRTLGPGEGFGELALLDDTPRTASVRAETALEVRVVPGDQFVRLHEQSPEVRDRMAALSFLYRLPGRGIALQWVGRHWAEESVERSWRLDDGRTFRSSYGVRGSVFRLELTSPGEAGAPTDHTFADASGRSRTIRLDAAGRVVGLFGVGTWGRLPELLEAALEGRPLAPDRLSSFAITGAVHLDAPPRPPSGAGLHPGRTVCFCMQVSRGAVHEAIGAGCRTYAELRTRTGCGSVCGGCRPAVEDLLGHGSFTPVTATAIPVREDLRCIRLHRRSGAWPPFHPGQHVVLEGFIDGDWVARAYTLTSPPTETGWLEVCVKREPRGSFSRWLFAGELGAKALQVSAPRGDLRWTPGGPPTVCLVAGIGITPALAIVRTVLTSGGADRVHVDYSAPSRSRLAFLDELEAAARACPGITVRARATRSEGRITVEEVRALAREFAAADFYLCGPEGYIAFVEQALVAAGVTRIGCERFVHAGAAPPAVPAEAVPDPPPRSRRAVVSLVLLGIGALCVMGWYLGRLFPGM